MKPKSIAALASLIGAGAAVAAMARARRLLTDLGTNPDPWTDLDLGPLDGDLHDCYDLRWRGDRRGCRR